MAECTPLSEAYVVCSRETERWQSGYYINVLSYITDTSYAHTHIAHIRIRTRRCSHTLIHTLIHSHTHAHTNTLTHSYTPPHSSAHTQTYNLTRIHTHTHAPQPIPRCDMDLRQPSWRSTPRSSALRTRGTLCTRPTCGPLRNSTRERWPILETSSRRPGRGESAIYRVFQLFLAVVDHKL